MITKNKKGSLNFGLKDYLVALLLFSGIIAVAFLMAANLSGDYGVNVIDPTIEAHYDQFATTYSYTEELQGSLGQLSFLDGIIFFLKAAMSVIGTIITSMALFPVILKNIMVDLGVPTVVSTIIVGVMIGTMVIAIVLKIISSTFNREL